MAARGENVHGEADFVEALVPAPASVLDAGCGTGRVAIELARRGFEVVGVDLDPAMLAQARAKAPDLPWVQADLATVDVSTGAGTAFGHAADTASGHPAGGGFDVVVLAGNVMIFVEPGTEAAVVANLARHLAPGGALVAGFQLDRGLDLATYDGHAVAAGLRLDQRWATWDRLPYQGGPYAVSVHRPG